MSKPARLQKVEPITIALSPVIIIAGFGIMLLILFLGIGFTDNYSILLAGV